MFRVVIHFLFSIVFIYLELWATWPHLELKRFLATESFAWLRTIIIRTIYFIILSYIYILYHFLCNLHTGRSLDVDSLSRGSGDSSEVTVDNNEYPTVTAAGRKDDGISTGNASGCFAVTALPIPIPIPLPIQWSFLEEFVSYWIFKLLITAVRSWSCHCYHDQLQI